ncbi:MAG TPA: hypothetical protein VH852_07490 [Hyphomicrobium sp.]|jgi:hypothetical protein
MRALKMIALATAFSVGASAGTRAEDIDALLLGGYWCTWEDKTKTEAIPQNRAILLVRQIEPANAADTDFTEYLVDVTNDVRGQRILLLQKQRLPDGTPCKTDCQLVRRLVNRDLLELGEWNSNTGIFKSLSPRDYIYRCER